ncbi:MAG: chorismate synthase [Ignavibacteriaceae bacterium]|nr:chorismate synthase [Ignavibacteriaceae bacterium]
MLQFITSGESHGKGLTVIINGMPSNLKIDLDFINNELKRRQHGYGRGLRMKIESDQVEILSGVRFGKTLGSPITLFIKNSDWENWTEKMSYTEIENKPEKVTIPRPGHADLVGSIKYDFDDIRNSIERSSARETAARVAACSVAKLYLREFGIKVQSFVESIGGIYPKNNFYKELLSDTIPKSINKINDTADKSPVRVLESEHETKIINRIKKIKKHGDTLGGTFIVVVTGVPVGLGTFTHFEDKLDAEIAQSIMSINAIKGVEIGIGFEAANIPGSSVHDEIYLKNKKIFRKTNRAGGIEGGISNGSPIIIRAAMKPIATLMNPLHSIDLATNKNIVSRRERSDFVAVPACAVIGESMAAWSISKYFQKKFGGDSMKETLANFENYNKTYMSNLRENFKND